MPTTKDYIMIDGTVVGPVELRSKIKELEALGSIRTLQQDRRLKQFRTELAKHNVARRAVEEKDDRDLQERARAKLARDPDTIDITRASDDEIRSASLKMLDRWDVTPAQGDHIDAMLRSPDGGPVARRMLTTAPAAYRSAFFKMIKTDRPILSVREQLAVERWKDACRDEIRAASEGGSFGLAVPAQIDPTIVPSAGERPTVAALSNNVTAVSDTYKGVVSDGSTWQFQAEGSVVADETPTLVQPVIPIFTARSFVPASDELVEDWPDFQEQFSKVLARGFADLLANVSAVGSGSGEPTGLFTQLAATTTNPAHVTVTTAGSISATDVRRVWGAVPERFKPQATWVMHADVLTQIRADAGAAAQVDLVVDRLGSTLMGRPVVTTSHAPDFTGTTGNASYLVVGDLSGYTVANRTGVMVERVQTMRDSVTGRPIGSRGWLAYARIGADVSVPSALRLLSNS